MKPITKTDELKEKLMGAWRALYHCELSGTEKEIAEQKEYVEKVEQEVTQALTHIDKAVESYLEAGGDPKFYIISQKYVDDKISENQTNLIDEILENLKPEPLYTTSISPAKQNTTGKKAIFRRYYLDKEERETRNEVRAEITKILEDKKRSLK